MARQLGIAWDTSDLLTFRLWSEPDGNWTNKGCEFTRNVVRNRHEDENPKTSEEVLDLSQFKFQKKDRTKKCKCNGKYAYATIDIPELDGTVTSIVMDESEGVMDVEQIVPPGNEDPQDVMEDDESVNPGGHVGSTEPEGLTRPTTPTPPPPPPPTTTTQQHNNKNLQILPN